jgi:hypothetical protein
MEAGVQRLSRSLAAYDFPAVPTISTVYALVGFPAHEFAVWFQNRTPRA